MSDLDSEDGVVKKMAKWKLYTIMLFMLAFVTYNTLIAKAMDEFEVGEVYDHDKKKHVPKKFFHPFVQAALMFFGEFILLFVYFIKQGFQIVKRHGLREIEKKKIEQMIEKGEVRITLGQQLNSKELEIQQPVKIIPMLMMSIPAMFDFFEFSLLNLGINQTSASIYQMIQGFNLPITAAMAVLFLGRKQYFHHIVGIFLIVGGVGLVSFAGMYTKHEDSAHPEHEAVAQATLFGVMMILLAQCFNASQHIVEEKLLQGDHLDPMLVVGIEGLCGCIFFAILLPIFQAINCNSKDFCNNGKIENTILAWQEIQQFPVVAVLCACIVSSSLGLHLCSIYVINEASANEYSSVINSSIFLVWVVSIFMGLESFSFEYLLSFIVLVVGTLIYNEIVIVPIDIMRRNTEQQILERKRSSKELLKQMRDQKSLESKSQQLGLSFSQATTADGSNQLFSATHINQEITDIEDEENNDKEQQVIYSLN